MKQNQQTKIKSYFFEKTIKGDRYLAKLTRTTAIRHKLWISEIKKGHHYRLSRC